MPHYEPLDIGLAVDSVASDLAAFQWHENNIKADFIFTTDTSRLLRVQFEGPCIVRIVDEMPLSTENDSPSVGLVSRHFAYRVRGAAFFNTQSEAWKIAVGNVLHYRFITGGGCLDVISAADPSFELIDRHERLS